MCPATRNWHGHDHLPDVFASLTTSTHESGLQVAMVFLAMQIKPIEWLEIATFILVGLCAAYPTLS